MMGLPGSGRARKASISFPRSATTISLVRAIRHSGTRLLAWTRNPEITARDSGFARYTLAPELTVGSGAGDEERRQPGLDILRDFLRGTILGVPEGAGAGKALQLPRDVVGYPGERGAGHDRFIRSDLDQIVLRIDAVV